MLSSCGGNPVISPSISPEENPSVYVTPTPSLVAKPVKGYIYGYNTLTEEGENVSDITVLEVPPYVSDTSGNVPLFSQISSCIEEEYPEDFKNSDTQELLDKLKSTLSGAKPLPEYNSEALVYSVYNDTPIAVGSDGNFENTVLTGDSDNTVKLEVALGEDNYVEVETLPYSDTINSSDAVTGELKSCPEKIFAFPGEVVIFKVYSEPGINLKAAGLKFTLENPSIGCITQPAYLCLFGAHKYQVAYGCVYIKPGLDTPVDSTITAKLNSGQSMSIFLEVIKKTASISGTVYTGGMPLVKGFVYSLGTKACCKLDSNGGYTLPKIFRGHGRSVIAIWWTSENGKKIRHREEKIIDFFDLDLTGFNFGVAPTPTPTPTYPPFTDEYYDYISSEILEQKIAWEEELGKEAGTQKIADWLNGLVPGKPIPDDITEAIKEVEVDEYEPCRLKMRFKSGLQVWLNSNDDHLSEDTSFTDNRENPLTVVGNRDSASVSISASTASTIKNKDVIMLGPVSLQDYVFNEKMFEETKKEFEDKGFNVVSLHTRNKLEYVQATYKNRQWKHQIKCYIKAGEEDNVVRPNDFLGIDRFGVIYIFTHGTWITLMACPYYENDSRLSTWLIFFANPDYFAYEWMPYSSLSYYKTVTLIENFFAEAYTGYDFSGSIVFVNSCESMKFHKGEESHLTPSYQFAHDAKVFIGRNESAKVLGPQGWAAKFFRKMLGTDDQPPMSIIDAWNITPSDKIIIDTGNNNENDNTYLPGDVEVTVHKK